LTVSKTESLTAWRAICSSNAPSIGAVAPRSIAREKEHHGGDEQAHLAVSDKANDVSEIAAGISEVTIKSPLKDGRDVYLLRFETGRMLQTGR